MSAIYELSFPCGRVNTALLVLASLAVVVSALGIGYALVLIVVGD